MAAGCDMATPTAPATRSAIDRAVLRHTFRLLRRGVLILAAAMATYVVVEVLAYLNAYPDQASRVHLATFEDDPAVRMLQGVPYRIDTVGGYVAWDAGWVLEVIVGTWALLTITRLLRTEEETERSQLTLSGPIRATRLTGLVLAVASASALIVGGAITVALVASDTGLAGSVALGLGITGLALTFIAVGAVTAQVFEVRRRAAGAAALALGLAYVVRMIASSSDSRAWVGWLTPLGWVEKLQPYGDEQWAVLAIPLAVSALLCAVAMVLRTHRDYGAGLITLPDRRAARTRLLTSPVRFAWRQTRGVLAAWAIGLGLYSFLLGVLVKTVVDFFADDPGFRQGFESLGLDMADLTLSFVGVMGVMLGVAMALYACWRIGAARAEEVSGRLEPTLGRPVSRWRWLGGHVALTGLSTVLVGVASGVGLWLGVLMTDAGVSFGDAMAAMLNPLPVAAVFAGLAVFAFGAIPRLTVGISVTATVVSYLLEALGPGLDLPDWVLSLSPFHHLATVPAESFATSTALVMLAIGSGLALAGLLLFNRRDVVPA
jgi:polyether ionophore transport system permease protein